MRNTAQNNSDLRLMGLARSNPSLGGRDLLMEIIERGPMPEPGERPNLHDVRVALKSQSLDDPDYRTRIEYADWLGHESRMMRDLYERGAAIKGDVLMIPAEAHEVLDDRETPFITTLSYARKRIGNIEQAREFHALARIIAGETADARMQIAVFKNYYDRVPRDHASHRDREAERAGAMIRTIEEMRVVAAEMARLETRESVEISDREVEDKAIEMNAAARKVSLRDESLRFPSGLSYETRERLISLTIPEIDRRLEKGVSRVAISGAINNTMFQRDSGDWAERELNERARIAGFLNSYMDERLRDPETRALNTSAVFREIRSALIDTKTPEELGRAAASFLRQNEQRSEELRLHRNDPDRFPLPEVMPLNARERNLLFTGRAPDHHSREMRELLLGYGLSRSERRERGGALHDRRIEPSDTLKTMLRELEMRKTAKAVAHFQAGILNEAMSHAGQVNLHLLSQRIPPHERSYLFEISEERKAALSRTPHINRVEDVTFRKREDEQPTGRAFGQAPRESRSFQEFMSNMGRNERRLLNDAISRMNPEDDRDSNDLSITDARNRLPEKMRDEIRLRARDQAWQSLVPADVFERNPSPEALKISETIAHIQEQLQDRARIAHAAQNDFAAEKVAAVERTKSERMAKPELEEERKAIEHRVIESLAPSDARQLAVLEQYAAHTREEVYRGFELLDIQRRNLEWKRVQADQPTRESDTREIFPLDFSEAAQRPGYLRFEPALVPSRTGLHIARSEIEEGGWNREQPAYLSRAPSLDSPSEWQFDSLREVLPIDVNPHEIESRGQEAWQHDR